MERATLVLIRIRRMLRSQREPITLVVARDDQGSRIDRFLRDALSVGRKDAWELLAQGAIRLERDGRVLSNPRKSEVLHEKDRLFVELHALTSAKADPSILLPVVFESELVVVCEKPAGLPSGALRTSPQGNVAAGLLARYPEMADVGGNRMEPGLIHRLDTWTSGLIVAARTQLGYEKLKAALKKGVLEKEYLAVVALGAAGATLKAGCELSIASELTPDSTNSRRVEMRPGTRFRTDARVVKASTNRALLLVRVARAYRHQIRVHLASVGLPLVGDATYGSPDLTGTPRHALHAHYVASNETPTFRARSPLPADLEALLGPPSVASSPSG